MTYKAIVIGATGAVGSAVVEELLSSSNWSSVTILTRRHTDQFNHLNGAAKLLQYIIDMENIESETIRLINNCDAAFCTLGVGEPTKATKENLWKVEVEYPTAFARACHASGVSHISLLTSIYSERFAKYSYFFRVKQTVEKNFRELRFLRTSFFRPSLLVTKNIRYGLKDYINQLVFPVISTILPSCFHEIKVEELAKAMRLNAEKSLPGKNIVEILCYKEMKQILDER